MLYQSISPIEFVRILFSSLLLGDMPLRGVSPIVSVRIFIFPWFL